MTENYTNRDERPDIGTDVFVYRPGANRKIIVDRLDNAAGLFIWFASNGELKPTHWHPPARAAGGLGDER